MRLEHIPIILGVIVALIGLGFIADASMAAAAPPHEERRRRTRAEPSRAGEAVVGLGTLCMAAALLGRDTWRYGTVAVLVGAGLLLIGVILNRAFLKEALLFRGPARRAEEGAGGKRGGAAVPPAARARGESTRAGGAPRPAEARVDPARPAPAPAEASRPAPAPRPEPSPRPEPARPAEGRPAARPEPSGPGERRKTPRGKK